MRRLLPLVFALAACDGPAFEGDLPQMKKTEPDKADSSNQATVLNFEFDAELLTDSFVDSSTVIQDQLLYTIGHLNGSRAVGRLDKLALNNVTRTASGGKTLIKYRAKMPVAWGSKTNLPSSYRFRLPRDVSYAALDSFTNKYKTTCVDLSAHDVDPGSMWYYYRPNRSGCSITASELVDTTARVTISPTNTTGRYPEFHKVWQDNELRVVAIFGKYEDGATTESDAGVAAYNAFVARLKTTLPGAVTQPESVSSTPGVANPDVTFTAALAGGKRVIVTALLVDNVRTAGAAFDARYASLSSKADLIMYNGHAGLGQNVRALARKGRWVAGQYLLLFMNGCDTFAYVDGYLAQTRAAINLDDPSGTKYLDIVTNAMPSYFHSNPGNSIALIKALMAHDNPKTFELIFDDIDDDQVVLVSGEEDNVFHPGIAPTPGNLLDESGSTDQGEDLLYYTPAVDPGSYTITLTGSSGDADLYVRVGGAPTHSLYDCRPYLDGSNETCKVTLSARNTIHILINGYAAGANPFRVTVKRDGSTLAPPPWAGMNESGSVARNVEKRWQTPALAPGSYVFTLSGTGGDADLYVRTGAAPTTSNWECRPYLDGSNETCTVRLNTAAAIHVMVRGYAASSSFRLVGNKQN